MIIKKCTNCSNFIAERCETTIPCICGRQWKHKKIDSCDCCPFDINKCAYSLNVATAEEQNNKYIKCEEWVPGINCPQNLEE